MGMAVTMLPKEKYIVSWDPPDRKSEIVSHAHAVLKRWSLTKNDPISDDDSDDSSTSSKSNHIIASSGDDSYESDNGGASDNSEEDESSIGRETMSNIAMSLTVKQHQDTTCHSFLALWTAIVKGSPPSTS
eukprot:scaffold87387_cov63-Attheya_sp.AAC.1